MRPNSRISKSLIRRRLNSLLTLLDVEHADSQFWWSLAQDLTTLDELAWGKLPLLEQSKVQDAEG